MVGAAAGAVEGTVGCGEEEEGAAAAAFPRPPLPVRVSGFADGAAAAAGAAAAPAGSDGPLDAALLGAAAPVAVAGALGAAAGVEGDTRGCLPLSSEGCLARAVPRAEVPSSCRGGTAEGGQTSKEKRALMAAVRRTEPQDVVRRHSEGISGGSSSSDALVVQEEEGHSRGNKKEHHARLNKCQVLGCRVQFHTNAESSQFYGANQFVPTLALC